MPLGLRRFGVLLRSHREKLIYFMGSVASLIADAAVVRAILLLSGHGVHVALANLVGCAVGSAVGFIIHVRVAFGGKPTVLQAMAYLLTFLGSLVLADVIITFSYARLMDVMTEPMAFWFAKGFSVALPFPLWYIVRKKLFLLVSHVEAVRRAMSER